MNFFKKARTFIFGVSGATLAMNFKADATLVTVGATIHKVLQEEEGPDTNAEESTSGRDETPVGSGFVHKKAVPVPRPEPVIQNPGYGSTGGVQACVVDIQVPGFEYSLGHTKLL